MCYIICPTCGSVFAAKVAAYEKRLQEGCKKYNLDYDTLSVGYLEKNDEYIKLQEKIIADLCDSYCCSIGLLTYVNIEKLVS